jgi:hypothetical protein
VRGDLVSEHGEATPHETGNAVGMAAGPPPLHQVADLEDGVDVRSATSTEGQPLHGLGQLAQAVHAGAALAGALPLHVPHDVGHFGQRADVKR